MKVGERIDVAVVSDNADGRTIVLNVDNETLPGLRVGHIVVEVDNENIGQADDYADVLDPTNDGGLAEYLTLVGNRGVQLLVSIPHFSTRTITISTLPTQPFPVAPPMYLVAVAGIILIVVLVVIIWRYLTSGSKNLVKN
ncbi:MAG: hypothetical protein AB1476_06025 [Candidatus Hadarchaeota archaeon]